MIRYCDTVKAAFNSKLGGATFDCHMFDDGQTGPVWSLVAPDRCGGDGCCRDKAAELNAAVCKLLPVTSANASWVAVGTAAPGRAVSYTHGVRHSYADGDVVANQTPWSTTAVGVVTKEFLLVGVGATTSVAGAAAQSIARLTAATFAMRNTTTATSHFDSLGVVWQLQFSVRGPCGNSTVFTTQVAVTSNAGSPPCCLPGYSQHPANVHGACAPANDGAVSDLCGIKPAPPPPGPPPPCAGRYRDFCSANVSASSTWCCNLDVFGCVCDQYGTFAQISFLCKSVGNGGIDCANCATARPQCAPAPTPPPPPPPTPPPPPSPYCTSCSCVDANGTWKSGNINPQVGDVLDFVNPPTVTPHVGPQQRQMSKRNRTGRHSFRIERLFV